VTAKKAWQMGFRELIEFLADMAEGYDGDPQAAKKIAAEIRKCALKPNVTREQVYAVHLDHPDWTAMQIADHLGTRPDLVNNCASRDGWKPRRLTREENAQLRSKGVSRYYANRKDQ
jgi:hypothetical protein